ncbi:TlpA family protein disulfide reductase [Niabella aurantiaca]|uniref:TlpA family protein disulfide reductase n=1 Tax=Niabella aurantiaca TaxID=379900 RepID=UPI00039D164A|nr:hypothetical protein [Niabella aurantiaca]
MKRTTLLGVMALFCLALTAQQNTRSPLLVGERLPNITFHNIINHTANTATLSGFQQDYTRLVLLDFWNTTCIPCIRAFKKLNILQQQYNNQLQIVLVTSEDSIAVKNTIANWEMANGQKLNIPIITKDSLLRKYIRRRYNPHYAWVAPDGVLLAQTSATFVTPDVVAAYMKTMLADVEHRGYKKRDSKRTKN